MPPSGLRKLSRKLAIPTSGAGEDGEDVEEDALAFDAALLLVGAARRTRLPPTIMAFGFCILMVAVVLLVEEGIVCVAVLFSLVCRMCDMAHSYVWQTSFVCLTCLFHV